VAEICQNRTAGKAQFFQKSFVAQIDIIFILNQHNSISSPAFDDRLVEIGGLPITVLVPSFFLPLVHNSQLAWQFYFIPVHKVGLKDMVLVLQRLHLNLFNMFL
jgi:hypothetical protein